MENTTTQKERHLFLDHPLLLGLLFPIFGQLVSLVPCVLLAGIAIKIQGPSVDRDAVINAAEQGQKLCQILLVPIFLILFKREFGKSFQFGFHKKNMRESFTLTWPVLLFTICNSILVFVYKDLSGANILYVGGSLLMCAAAGFYEEAVFRGILIPCMMRKWKNHPRCIYQALIVSSLFFGLIHLTNALGQSMSGTVAQVFYCIAMGILYGAVYLRTRNLWGIAIAHSIFDIPGILSEIATNEPSDIFSILNLSFMAVMIILSIIIGLFLVRKEKLEQIKALWADAFPEPAETEA